jgi:hypothetical protein
MSTSIVISSVNYDGELATILFKPDNNNTTINLGNVVLPYTFDASLLNPPRLVFGTYTILVNNSTCPNILQVPRPTPTPTKTSTPTPTNTLTQTITPTPTITLNPCLLSPTPTSTQTPTPTPTNTSTPTNTPTNTPTPTLTPLPCLQLYNNWWNNNSYFSYSSITDFYTYSFLPGQTFISNGGFNMFNTGNVILLDNPIPRTYGTVTSTFVVTRRNIWPHLTLYPLLNTTSTRSISEIGTPLVITGFDPVEGFYTVTREVILSDGTYSSGNYGGSWYRYSNIGVNPSFLSGDTPCPSVEYVWFTVESSLWGSSIDSVDDERGNQSTSDRFDSTMTFVGRNAIVGMVLLSRYTFSGPSITISDSEIQEFLESSIGNMFNSLSCNIF